MYGKIKKMIANAKNEPRKAIELIIITELLFLAVLKILEKWIFI